MSDQSIDSTSNSAELVEQFVSKWDAGVQEFFVAKAFKPLRDAFELGASVCKSSWYLVELTLSAHRATLDMILKRNDSETSVKLGKIRDEMVALNKFLHPN